MPRSPRPASSRISVPPHTEVSPSLSPWERAGVRVRSLVSEGKEKVFSSLGAVSPHPDPLPEGEGMRGSVLRQGRTDLRPLTPDLCSGRVRLSILLTLCALLFALCALPFIARTRAASIGNNSLSPWERAGVRVRSIAGETKEKEFLSSRAVSPHPNPLPKGEGTPITSIH